MNTIRWPWPDLEHALRAAGYRTRCEQTQALGITLRTRERWRKGGIPDRSADHAAVAIGSHPACIWTTWHLGASSPLSEDEAA